MNKNIEDIPTMELVQYIETLNVMSKARDRSSIIGLGDKSNSYDIDKALKFYQKVYTDRVIDLILFVNNEN